MKGALTAIQCARIIRKSLVRKFPNDQFVLAPIADGGNGTLECLLNAFGGTMFEAEVTSAIPTEKTAARFGVLPDSKTAIIESAEAIGLHKIVPSPQTIAYGTSRGIGEIILEIVARGCTKIYIGLGGTATNDCGAGMASALGVEFVNEKKQSLPDGAISLIQLNKIMNYELRIMKNVRIQILSDVKNSLLGNHGATYTFAEQKGASKEQLPYLEASLKNFADVVEQTMKKEFRNIPGSGAAGGLGFGLAAFCNAEIISGIDFALDVVQFDEKLKNCDCVITCEGKIDSQTTFGKGIAGISERAKKYNKPIHVFAGRIDGDEEQLKEKLNLASLTQISPREISIEQAIKDASWLLADAVFNKNF